MRKKKNQNFLKIPLSDVEIICNDFAVFCDYVVGNRVKISKNTGQIGKKDCFELNKLLYRKEAYEKATRFQVYYPIIHFFHYIALKYRILEFNTAKNGLVYGRNYGRYQDAPAIERYVLFLLNFLFDVSYMGENHFAPFHIEPFFDWVDEEKLGKGKIYQVPYNIFREDYYSGPGNGITPYLEELRLIRTYKRGICSDRSELSLWEIEELELLKAVSYLYNERFAEEEYQGDVDEKIEYYFGKYMDILEPSQKKHTLSEIFLPIEITIKNQTIDLKVSMRWYDCSRTIRMNQSDLLYELHLAIQDAFDFDNDHLFDFRIGKGALKKTYCMADYLNYSDELPVEETLIGELELAKGENFTYLFDYGDCWWFDIKVVRIADGNIPKPILIESVNDAPIQYPAWE